MDNGLAEWMSECLEPLGRVTSRAMMGGLTFYCDGTIFAILATGQIWFKADKVSDAEWDAAQCPRFTYDFGDGRTGSMNYRRAPDAVYDDAEAMLVWARLGLAAGSRAPARKKNKAKPG